MLREEGWRPLVEQTWHLPRDESTNFRRAPRHFDEPPQENTGVPPSRFKAPDLGFFHLDAPDSYELGNIIFAHKETIYREVFTFVERVNDYAHVVGEVVVRDNLSLCLRDSVMTWYLKKMNDFKRRAFRSLPLLDFIDELQNRFKMRISKALGKLTLEIFIAKDAKDEREATRYLQNIILYAQLTSIEGIQRQLT